LIWAKDNLSAADLEGAKLDAKALAAVAAVAEKLIKKQDRGQFGSPLPVLFSCRF